MLTIMNKVLFIIALFFFNLLIDCKGQLDINIDKALENKRELLLSEIAISIDFIQLETKVSSYFNSPSQIKFINENIYFFDKGSSKFFMFDLNGKFLNQFGKKGKGPKEFVAVQNFALDNRNNELIIFTREQKILKYNLDGNFINYLPIEGNPVDLLPINGYFLGFYPNPICMENNGNTFSLFNNKGELIKSLYNNIHCESRGPILYNRFYPFNNELRFWDMGIDTVFSIDTKLDVYPLYTFSSKKKMPYRMYSSIKSLQEGVRKNYLSIQNIKESNRYLFITVMYNQTFWYIIYDNQNNTSVGLQNHSFSKAGIKDNLITQLYFWPKEILPDGRIVCLIESMDLIYTFTNVTKETKSLLQNKYQKLNKIIETSKIDDNPILVIITLKNN